MERKLAGVLVGIGSIIAIIFLAEIALSGFAPDVALLGGTKLQRDIYVVVLIVAGGLINSVLNWYGER